ncbi:sensor histidine kinase [Streptomyces tritici]|uniref:sensor histidine kinase n=1 Tax=Streptomyces tritici TaxID=2054410 RepID=UPI003AF0AB62
MRRAAAAVFGRRAVLRWVHLILGGALLMPYWLLGTVVMAPLFDGQGMFAASLGMQFAAYGFALPLVAVTALFPLARPMSVAVARALCDVRGRELADGPARGREARTRTAGWLVLHVGLGGLLSGATLALPPFALTLMALPFSERLQRSELTAYYGLDQPWAQWLGVPVALLMLTALAAVAAGAGALLAGLAPLLLGPSRADRLAAAERRAEELAVRNRLARELHDSVGHALSAVTLQAGAARRLLDSDAPGDREFVREALAAIEETTRRTVGELDHVLGLLRRGDEPSGELPGPGLEALDALARGAGATAAVTWTGDLERVPPTVSREAYRIVQEGLTNAARYAGGAPVTAHLALGDEELEITMENPLSGRPAPVRPGGGRGLRGVAERARLLGGTSAAGPVDGVWRLTARLPLGGGR